MELSYATTSNPDGGMIAVAVSFTSLMFLGCLTFTLFIWRRLRLPIERIVPSDKLTMSFIEQVFVGALYGSPHPNIAARVRALRVHRRRSDRTFAPFFLSTGIIMTIYSAIFLIIILSALVLQQSWLAKLIASNFPLIGPYILLPLFIILGVMALTIGFLILRLWTVKDRAPIRVKNETHKVTEVYIRGTLIGEVYPGAEIDNKMVLSVYDTYLVEAKDMSGDIFYSKEFSLDELDTLDWKITIEREL